MATGDETGQKKDLIKKVSTWCNMVEAASGTWHEARNAVNTNIGSTIQCYPLTVSVLSKPQCKEMAKAMLKAALPKPVVRNAATAIVYATHEMGGLGFKDIHVTQLIERIKVLLDHWPTATVAGKILRIVTEATRGNIYDAYATKDLWVDHLGMGHIQDTNTYNIQLLQNNIMDLEGWRENDSKHSDYFDAPGLCRINYVRLYLQVNTLLDISNAKGDHIRIPTFNSVHMDLCSKASYKWPTCDEPSTHDSSLW